MKKLLFTFVSAFMCTLIYANSHQGKWYGKLQVNSSVNLTVAFEIESDSNDVFNAVMHSVDQKSFNIAVDNITVLGDTITLEVKMLGIMYKGVLAADSVSGEKNRLTGTFGNPGKGGLSLNLTRCDVFPFHIAKRPQEPKKPYPYHSEDVSFVNKKLGISLKGTFTKPFGSANYPAVVLISGSGPSDRNQTIFGHKVFLVIADYLTRNGFAVLRYDDRGAGESEGSFRSATVLDHAEDASFAIEYLKSRTDIDTSKIGLIGHSLGAEIAPIVATINSSASFLVLMAGAGVSLKEVIFEQSEAIYTSKGASKEAVDLNRNILANTIEIFKNSANDSIAKEDVKKALATFDSRVKTLDQRDRDITGLNSPLKFSSYSGLLLPFMRYDLFHNPSEILKQVKTPVFALIGDKDIQVLPYNLKVIEEALTFGGNKRVTTRLYKGLNHLLQNCTTGEVSEYGEIEETISEQVVNDIIKWIKTQTL